MKRLKLEEYNASEITIDKNIVKYSTTSDSVDVTKLIDYIRETMFEALAIDIFVQISQPMENITFDLRIEDAITTMDNFKIVSIRNKNESTK